MWRLDDNKARLESPQLTCQLDLALPAHGVTGLRVAPDSNQLRTCNKVSILRLMVPSQDACLTDAYVRGNDLVATYAESSEYPCRLQVYWRFESAAEYVGVQMIVSVQTSVLDATPGLIVTSQLSGPPKSVKHGTIVASLHDSDLCYAEITDCSNIESTRVRDSKITYRLFPGSLEKGVIRRARILTCFLPEPSAEQTAQTLREQFIRSTPPLTT